MLSLPVSAFTNSPITSAQEDGSRITQFQGHKVRKSSKGAPSILKTALIGALLSSSAAASPSAFGTPSVPFSRSLTQLNPPQLSLLPLSLHLGVDLNAHNATSWIEKTQQSNLIEAKASKHNNPEFINNLIGAIQTHNDVEMRFLKLVDKTIDLNVSIDEKGRTLLHLAVEHHFLEGIKILVEAGADPNQGDRVGMTPLHHAVMRKATDVMTLLGALGADPNKLCFEGYAPLHFVDFFQDKESKKALLQIRGANPKIQSEIEIRKPKGNIKTYRALIRYATSSGPKNADHPELRKRLLAAIHSKNYQAILNEDFENTDLNYPLDEYGRSYLHYLAASKDHSMEKTFMMLDLIANGAMPCHGDKFGLTPLHYAIIHVDFTTIPILMCGGANSKQLSLDGFSARDIAKFVGISTIFEGFELACELKKQKRASKEARDAHIFDLDTAEIVEKVIKMQEMMQAESPTLDQISDQISEAEYVKKEKTLKNLVQFVMTGTMPSEEPSDKFPFIPRPTLPLMSFHRSTYPS